MKADKNIQNEVEKTLNSLDNWEKIKADAFFYTRLSARMDKSTESPLFSWLFNTQILKPALIATALLINILSLAYISFSDFDNAETDFSDAFADEYMIDHSTESYIVMNE